MEKYKIEKLLMAELTSVKDEEEVLIESVIEVIGLYHINGIKEEILQQRVL